MEIIKDMTISILFINNKTYIQISNLVYINELLDVDQFLIWIYMITVLIDTHYLQLGRVTLMFVLICHYAESISFCG